MGPNWQSIVIVAILIIVLFGGRGRISGIMGDMAKGIKSFRKGLSDEDEDTQKKDAARQELSASEDKAATMSDDTKDKTAS